MAKANLRTAKRFDSFLLKSEYENLSSLLLNPRQSSIRSPANQMTFNYVNAVCTLGAASLLLIVILAGCSDGVTKDDATSNQHRQNFLASQQSGLRAFAPSIYFKPLKPTESQSGKSKRFRPLQNCGIDFNNFMHRSQINLLVETGAGVALGDFDGDGRPDIYLTGSDIANKLYRNLGNLKFEDVTDKAGVDGRINDTLVWSSGASFADIDNDGDLDLYVCNMSASNLLYVNQGDGTFEEQTRIRGAEYTGASKQANFCDYDRDGDLDFYLVTYQDKLLISEKSLRTVNGQRSIIPGREEYVAIIDGHEVYKAGEPDLLFRNDGSGNFKEVASESGIAGFDAGLASIWFDHDDDGWQDLYVTSDFKQPDHLYKNLGDGKFKDILPQTVSRTPWFSMGLDAGDMNNDGLLDLIVSDMADQTHYGQKVNMGNMSADGWFLEYGNPRQFMKNCFFVNSGTPRFMEVASQAGIAKSNWTWSVRTVDLNNDGLLDVYFTNGHSRDNMNSDIETKIAKMRADPNTTVQQKLDFFMSIPVRKDTNLAYANTGNLKFEDTGAAWGLDHHGVSHSAAFADLDSDGDLDCVVNNYYQPTLIYENQSLQGNRLIVELRSDQDNLFGIGSKVEVWHEQHYQRRDLMPGRGYLSSDPMSIHLGLDEDILVDKLKVTWPDGISQSFENLPAGRLYRIFKSRQAEVPADTRVEQKDKPRLFSDRTKQWDFSFAHKESNYSDFEAEPLLPFRLSRLGSGISLSDVNADGYVDVYCGGARGQAGQLLLNDAGSRFINAQGPFEDHANSEDMGSLFFDADGDGDDDLYVVSGSNEAAINDESYRDRLYVNDGQGNFKQSPHALPEIGDSGSCVAAADFDRDGDLDLFVGSRSVPGKYPLAPQSRLLINENGVFALAELDDDNPLTNVGLVNSAIWSDFDSDGWIDLIVAVEWGPVTFFKNNQGKLQPVTEELGVDQSTGWWHGIAPVDIDLDGDLDYVVTNQGTNTKYHASAEHPHRLYYDDFDSSGTIDLVEAEFEGDIEYPIRGRSCSSRCMPFIAKKFETFHDYSVATLSDIYGTDQSNKPFRELTYLQSSVFVNDGGKRFSIVPLPSMAQISPCDGVAADDFDGDGRPDILLATNFFGSQPETGYMDGALCWLLKGHENGVKAVWPNKSGVIIPGDANALATADFDNDGDQDAIFGINDGHYNLLINQADHDQSFISVSLLGPSGNPQAIGSRLLLKFKDGTSRMIEISAGGSYLSQSANNPVSFSNYVIGKLSSLKVFWADGRWDEIPLPKLDQKHLKIKHQQ